MAAKGIRTRMKREGYQFGVAWIANNDNPGDNETAEVIAGYITVALLADLFHKRPATVANDVLTYRENHARAS
jgi:hypothetical protein